MRELRELVRYRAKLVRLRSGLKAQVHAVMAKEGVPASHSRHVRRPGNAARRLDLPQPYAGSRVAAGSDRELDREIAMLEQVIHSCWPGTTATRRFRPSPVSADARRDLRRRDRRRHPVPGPKQLCSWAGLTPRHRESDTK